ncbi:hypothetical protein VTN77DRAFT_9725 [Rasamsonia byssochlamydoides]|uniref:uncharacterized protein n=1 Tax=Rasamsonia byssochlamydoides TaxID=89139 RepID=UPI0037434385
MFQDWDAKVRSEDGSLKGTALERYNVEVVNAFEKAGYPPRPGPYLEEWFREAGFVDIHVKKYYVPQGAWPRDPYYVEKGFRTAAMAVLTRFESWKPEEVEVLAAGALNDVKNPKIHTLYDFYVVYGRRPESTESTE